MAIDAKTRLQMRKDAMRIVANDNWCNADVGDLACHVLSLLDDTEESNERNEMKEQLIMSIEECIRDHISQDLNIDAAIAAASREIVEALLRPMIAPTPFVEAFLKTQIRNS